MIHEILSGENNDPTPYPIVHIVAALENLALDMAWEERNQQVKREAKAPEDDLWCRSDSCPVCSQHPRTAAPSSALLFGQFNYGTASIRN